MARPALGPLAIAALLVLAGCTGLPAAGTGTATESSTPTHRDTPDATDTVASDVTFPAGTSRSGIEDVAALVAAHRSALNGTSYRVDATRTGDPGPMNLTLHVATVGGYRAVRLRERAGGPGQAVSPHQVFKRGVAKVRRTTDGGDAVYAYSFDDRPGDAPAVRRASAPHFMLAFRLGAVDFEYDGTTTPSETTLFRFVAGGGASGTGSGATVVVSEAGVVQAARGTGLVGEDSSFSYELDRDVGPPAIPDWVGAVAQPVVLSGPNGSSVAVEHHGGPPIPAGAGITVTLTDGGAVARNDSLALPTELTQDERVYVYAVRTDGGPELRVSASAPPADVALLDLTGMGVVVHHDGESRSFELRTEVGNGTTR